MNEVFSFYSGYIIAQKIIFSLFVIYSILKKGIKKEYFFIYFFFNFLSISGAMGHIKYNLDVTLKAGIFLKILLFLILLLGATGVYFFVFKNELSWIFTILISQLLFLYISKIKTPQHFSLSFWEFSSFLLFLFYLFKLTEEKDEFYEIRYDVKLLYLIPLIFSLFIPHFAILPLPTILACFSFYLIFSNIDKKDVFLLSLFSIFSILFSTYSKNPVKFAKIILLVVIVSSILRLRYVEGN
ncbi:MAG: hypothetical protein DRI36_01515 [Caldiserica bacterium]|nr:MAG: hypothetical protein DRI36_01515 [Caldisericota bacterium]